MAQTFSNNGRTNEVLVEERASVRTFILNRPKQLNALSYQMIFWLLELFHASEGDSNVKMIIFKGNGTAFCAGGDATSVVRNIRQSNWKWGADYIREECTLNYVMATYSKSQVSILDEIVMGGGLGVSVHGTFRVAIEKSVCAMPETTLGLFPDAGASYFYSRLPGFFGEYAGLTGARLDGAEMLACGLATHFVHSERLPFLEQALIKVNTSDPDVISAIISRFSNISKLKAESPYHKMKIIDHCFSRRTIEEIISRAILIDKDRNPKWEPSRPELITDDDVDRYFSKIDDEDWQDLKLPPRSNLPPYAIAKL
ncbi:3-hydroxyisobutyryl-CoA hydrolase 1-like [Lycium barbarum]|uniref:3-hydroxyisobutyryl-CoA hydrolase 1-like n=1 Tax=Lycium barbarum TaxID=112863 RepID=UPI00293E45BE|nr:3-hydroxyisobutyryl-CoA hydrolase 1-like [Lycium barbarum]